MEYNKFIFAFGLILLAITIGSAIIALNATTVELNQNYLAIGLAISIVAIYFGVTNK